jgi:hypothetical protein
MTMAEGYAAKQRDRATKQGTLLLRAPRVGRPLQQVIPPVPSEGLLETETLRAFCLSRIRVGGSLGSRPACLSNTGAIP